MNHAKKLAAIILLALTYYVAAKLGFIFSAFGGRISALWLPSGIALSVLFIFGKWLWPAILLGGFLANLNTGAPVSASIFVGIGNMLAAYLGVWLLKRLKDFRPDFSRVKDVANFFLLATAISPLVNAGIGVGTYWLWGMIPSEHVVSAFATWWSGDAIGILFLFPLVLILYSAKWQMPSHFLKLEAIFVSLCFIWVAVLVITSDASITFIVFPFIVWSAIRFQQLGVVIMVMILGFVTIPIFILKTQSQSDLMLLYGLQFYLSSVSLTGLLLAAYVVERKKIESELRTAIEAAKSATVVKSRFLDIAAHELRTPVTSFSLIVQLAIKQLERGRPVEESTLLRLRSQSERISHLVIDLLDVSRLERGGLILKLEQKFLTEIIDDCLNDFKLRHPNRNVSVKKPNDPLPKINIDATRIYQVISNLLDNAAKFTPDDSPLEIVLESLSGQIQFSLIDHGPGITKEQQAVMFTPFTRGSTELTKRSGGLGLGLYICREIIRLHGGEIGVSSELGKGTTFYFRLAI